MNSDNFFDGTFLLQLERLGVKAKTAVASHLRGQHRSKRSGQGMVFSDYRSYSEGDDTRNLDWGIFLRLDKLIIRLFEEEADLPIYIFLDVSESMSFGSPEKLHFGKKFSAALAYISLMNHDRVSLVAFSENVLQIMPTQRGNKQV